MAKIKAISVNFTEQNSQRRIAFFGSFCLRGDCTLGKKNWKEKINPETLELISFLESLKEKRGEEVHLTLAKYFYHPDYLVKSKAFAVAADLACPALIPLMAKIVREEDEEFRLRAIEVLQKTGSKEALGVLKDLLADPNPLIIRGAIVAMGGIKGIDTVKAILEFASSPAGRIVRPEIVQEAVSFALDEGPGAEEALACLAKENASIRRYLRLLDLKRPPIPNFTVYPSNDYFRLQAKKRGIDYKVYKGLIS